MENRLSKFVVSTIVAGLTTISLTYYNFVVSIFSWLSPEWLRWNRNSETMLRALEKKILQFVRTPYRGWYVDIGPVVGPADKIWTLSFNTESQKTPIVLLHGLGAGVALWCLNLDALAATRPVYAFDILGFGRSSRPHFSMDSTEAESQMIRSIEEWRKEMRLKEFILLGHSMGGFLAASYAISHAQRVRHLVLADPWGFPERAADPKDVPLWIKTLAYMMQPFNPLAGIRVAGPLGPWFINTLRPDITKKYIAALKDPNLIPQYIYQCNSQNPSGESAFHSMMSNIGWAKNPIVRRIDNLSPEIPITLLYGSRSWADHSATEIIRDKRIHSYFKLQVVNGAGHHVHADKPEAFNQIVIDACNYTDNEERREKLAIMSAENEVPESDKNMTSRQSDN